MPRLTAMLMENPSPTPTVERNHGNTSWTSTHYTHRAKADCEVTPRTYSKHRQKMKGRLLSRGLTVQIKFCLLPEPARACLNVQTRRREQQLTFWELRYSHEVVEHRDMSLCVPPTAQYIRRTTVWWSRWTASITIASSNMLIAKV